MKKKKFNKQELCDAFVAGVEFQKEFVVKRFSNLMGYGIRIETPNFWGAFDKFIKEKENGKKENTT